MNLLNNCKYYKPVVFLYSLRIAPSLCGVLASCWFVWSIFTVSFCEGVNGYFYYYFFLPNRQYFRKNTCLCRLVSGNSKCRGPIRSNGAFNSGEDSLFVQDGLKVFSICRYMHMFLWELLLASWQQQFSTRHYRPFVNGCVID